jgi:hypothetical protein
MSKTWLDEIHEAHRGLKRQADLTLEIASDLSAVGLDRLARRLWEIGTSINDHADAMNNAVGKHIRDGLAQSQKAAGETLVAVLEKIADDAKRGEG